MNRFDEQLQCHNLHLRRSVFETLQLNVGRKCNQACRHCHVDAAPWRTEMMEENTAHKIALWIREFRPPIVDLTGGAPELNPNFRFLVDASINIGARVIDRCNLTIIEEQDFSWIPEFLASRKVEIVASLPCYTADNVNRQRGNHAFEKSISALRKLNALGYGTALPLNLVYNPLGANLPPPQAELEGDYRENLLRDFGIVFNHLYSITNQPIARFAEDLKRQQLWDAYLDLLANSFNPGAVPALMCRSTLSVDYQGLLFDCDFNQMLGLGLGSFARPIYLWELTPSQLERGAIRTDFHCMACTAGHGSSCTGALTN